MKPLPLAELRPLIAKFSLRYQALAVIGVMTGARVSEILELRVFDVVDAKMQIREEFLIPVKKLLCGVPREKQRNLKRTLPVRRKVYIHSAWARDILSRYVALLRNERGFERMDDYLFAYADGRAVSRHGVYAYFRKFMGRGYGTHWMRKTFAWESYTYLTQVKGMEFVAAIRNVQKFLGHKRFETTVRYLGFGNEEIERCSAEIFGRL